jgi:hypothetical protein
MSASLFIIFAVLLLRCSTFAQICAVEGYFSGQNLAIADISGSTPNKYPDTAQKPQPSTAAAWKCIRLPEHRALNAGTYPNNVDPQKAAKRKVTAEEEVEKEDDSPVIRSRHSQKSKRSRHMTSRQAAAPPCKPYSLLFARGTMPDWGTMGSVGDALGQALQSQSEQVDIWHFEDVKYWNDGGGFSCYGLPGGRVVLDQLNALGNRCNDTKIVVGGFSQGTIPLTVKFF